MINIDGWQVEEIRKDYGDFIVTANGTIIVETKSTSLLGEHFFEFDDRSSNIKNAEEIAQSFQVLLGKLAEKSQPRAAETFSIDSAGQSAGDDAQ